MYNNLLVKSEFKLFYKYSSSILTNELDHLLATKL